MTLGQAIKAARTHKKMKQEALGAAIDKSLGAVSNYENDVALPDPETVEKIAKVLDSNAVRMAYLRNNPVYQSVIPRAFSDLNNIRREPAIIFTRTAKECDEARESALILAEIFSNADPSRVPDFANVLKNRLEQLLDAKRAIEILEVELVETGVLTMDGLREVYEQQHHKCVERGHHVPKGPSEEISE